MELEEEDFNQVTDCLALRGCKNILIDRNDTTYVSKALPRLISFGEINRYVHTMLTVVRREETLNRFFRSSQRLHQYFLIGLC